MIGAWLDANVVIRFITGDPEADAKRARRLIARAEAGEVRFRLKPITVAEVVWVLGTPRYGYSPREVADSVAGFARADGILIDESDVILEALGTMVDRGVSFVDAYLAVCARQTAEPVCTFDADFKRLGVELLS